MFQEPSKIVTAKICPRCSREFSASGNINICPHDQSLLSLVTADPFIGTVIANHYLVTEILGQGGWSVVYRAQHETIKNRHVAIKILHSHLVRDRDKVLRFQREAEAAMSLQHPQVAAVYDYGVLPEGQPFIVMEYLEGTALSELLAEQGALPLERVITIGKQACAGLAAAHDNRVIHRDVKPSNIFITKDPNGQELVKILDFGLAKIVKTEESGTLTQTGETMGTPDYMSPEQCLGMALDARTDIYTLGYVLYEALTGKQAVAGKNTYESMNSHIYEMPPTLSEANPDVKVPDAIEAVIFKALSKNPDERFQTALEMRDALERASAQKEHTLSAFKKLLGAVRRKPRYARQKKAFDPVMLAIPLTAILVLGAIGFKVYELRHKAAIQTTVSQNPLESWKSVNTQGINAYNENDYKAAVGFFEKAQRYGAQLAEDSEQHKISLNYLKDAYTKLGDRVMAQKVAQKIAAIEEAYYYKEYGRWDENEAKIRTLYGQMLAHPADKTIAAQLAETLNNQTALALSDAKLDVARTLVDQANGVELRVLGKAHPEYGKTVSNLAAITFNSGKRVEAEALYKQALEIREKALGPNDPLVARSCRNLAEYYRRMDKYDQAIPLVKRSIEIYRQAGEKYCDDYARSLNTLGITYLAAKNYPEAKQALDLSLNAWIKSDGPESIDYGRALCNLGQLNRLQNHYAQAEKQVKEAMQIFENKLGPTTVEYGLASLNLGEIYLETNQPAAAEKYLRRALSVFRATEPLTDRTIMTFQKLCVALQQQNKIDEARNLTREIGDVSEAETKAAELSRPIDNTNR